MSGDVQLSFCPSCLKSNLEGSGAFNQCHSLTSHITLRPSSLNLLSVVHVLMETVSSLECRCCLGKQTTLSAWLQTAYVLIDVQIPGIGRISRT